MKNKKMDQAENSTTSPIIRYEEGQSMTAIWAVKSLGIDPATGEEIFLKKDGVTTTYDWSADRLHRSRRQQSEIPWELRSEW